MTSRKTQGQPFTITQLLHDIHETDTRITIRRLRQNLNKAVKAKRQLRQIYLEL